MENPNASKEGQELLEIFNFFLETLQPFVGGLKREEILQIAPTLLLAKKMEEANLLATKILITQEEILKLMNKQS